jgi:hypothetical protein
LESNASALENWSPTLQLWRIFGVQRFGLKIVFNKALDSISKDSKAEALDSIPKRWTPKFLIVFQINNDRG